MADYTLSAKITGDSSGFKSAFSTAESAAKSFQSKIESVTGKLDSLGGKLQGIGAKISAASIPLVAFGKKSVDYASDLQESQNVIDVTFGDNAQTINEWAKAAGNAYGMSELQAKKYNGTMGAMLKSMGMADNAVIDMSTSMTGLAGDMASFYNLPMDQAFDKIRAGISGETEPLKQLGINMSVANLEAYALSQGIDKSYDSMTQAEQATLRYNYLMQATADAQGDFARTGDSYANMCRKTELAVSTLSQTVGQVLMPYFYATVQRTQELITKFQALDPSIQTTIIKAAALVPVIGAALMVLGTATKGVGSFVKVLGLIASPIGIVVVAIGTLAAGFMYLMNTNQAFHDKVIQIWDSVKAKVSGIASSLPGMLQGLFNSDLFSGISGAIQTVFTKLPELVRNGLGSIAPIVSSALGSLPAIFQGVMDGLGRLFDNGGLKAGAFIAVIVGIASKLGGPIGSLASIFVGGFGKIGGAVSTAANIITANGGGISGAIKGITTIFSQAGGITGIFTTGIKGVGSALGGLLSPVGLVVGVITALVAGFVYLMATNSQFRESIMSLVGSIGSSLAPILTMIKNSIMQIATTVLPVIISLIQQLLPFIGQIVMVIMQIVAAVAPMITQLVGALLPVITNIITVLMNVISSVMPAIIAILNVVMSVIQTLVPIITNILGVVVSVISGIISAIGPIVSFIGGIISAIMAIISPIVTFIADIIATVIQVVGTVIGAVTGVFDTVFSVVSGVWNNICDFVSTAINAISTVISTLTEIVGGVFNSIYSTVSSVMTSVGSFIQGIFDGIKSAWNGLTSFVSGVFDGISSAVSKLVSTVKGFVNGVIGGINSAIGLINMIPGVSIGTIPYLLHGTDDWQGGFARMNEGGRGELTYLPDGTQVIPHDISMRYAKEAARTSGTSDSIDLSGILEGMVIQVINNTNVDGTPLKEVCADYTVRKIGNQSYGTMRSRGRR